ncbi:unnamed protein product, partial [Staurois parvus]
INGLPAPCLCSRSLGVRSTADTVKHRSSDGTRSCDH